MCVVTSGGDVVSFFSAKKEFRKKTRNHDSRLSKREFREFVHRVVEKMSGQDAFDYFVDFMLNSVEVRNWNFINLFYQLFLLFSI